MLDALFRENIARLLSTPPSHNRKQSMTLVGRKAVFYVLKKSHVVSGAPPRHEAK